MMRNCSGCTLCCKLVPVKEMDKPAGQRCKHQRLRGCAVYGRTGMPWSCKFWNCRWLVNDDAADLRRPDRSHYVIDIMPDFVTMQPHDGSAPTNIEVVQIWVDPDYPEAWRDPALLAWLARRGEEGKAALIRFSSSDAITVFPPALADDGQWHEIRHGTVRPTHTFTEIAEGIARAKRVKVGE